MDTAIKAAIITGGLGFLGVVYTKGKWWAKTPESPNLEVKTRDVSSSLVAAGSNITQNQRHIQAHNHIETQNNIQNFYGVPPADGKGLREKVASKPTMIEIRDAIQSATPYNRIQISKDYVGLKVCWPVVYAFLHEQNLLNKWEVGFSAPTSNLTLFITIRFRDLDEYPKLKVIQSGHHGWVEGIISSIDLPIIQLEDGAEITLD